MREGSAVHFLHGWKGKGGIFTVCFDSFEPNSLLFPLFNFSACLGVLYSTMQLLNLILHDLSAFNTHGLPWELRYSASSGIEPISRFIKFSNEGKRRVQN